MAMTHDLNDVLKGFVPYATGDRPLPKGTTQEKHVVGFAMQVYATLTHLAAKREDGTNPFPAKFGDVLLNSTPRSLNRKWRNIRTRIHGLLHSPNWPLLGEGKSFRSKTVAAFVEEVLDFMAVCRQTYIVDAAERTQGLTASQRKAMKQIPMEADDLRMAAGLPEKDRASVIAAILSGKPYAEAVQSVMN